MTSELATTLIAQLRRGRQTLAVAESCTGGEVLAALTGVPGASESVWGGAVVYVAAAKTALAGVAPRVIDQHGVVSEEVTLELARGIRRRASSDLGGAVTGWAGPTSEGEHPVGTVFLAVVSAAGEVVVRRRYGGGRSEVRYAATCELLQLIGASCSDQPGGQ